MKSALAIIALSTSLFALNSFAAPYKGNCTLNNGMDSLQSFVLVLHDGGRASINGIAMRDMTPKLEIGLYYTPQFRDYNFQPEALSTGWRVFALKRDGTRLFYHCTPIN